MKLYRPVGNKTLIPVGMVVFTYTKTNPSTWFGGTWEQLSGGYLYLCTNSTEKTTYTGTGTQSTTLTTNQIPAHTHGSKSLTGAFYTYDYVGARANGVMSEGVANQYGVGFSGQSSDQTPWKWFSIDASHEHTSVGGGKGHTHNIATVGFFAWRRTA